MLYAHHLRRSCRRTPTTASSAPFRTFSPAATRPGEGAENAVLRSAAGRPCVHAALPLLRFEPRRAPLALPPSHSSSALPFTLLWVFHVAVARPCRYFSYKWAEVLSADAYAAFEEVGLEDEAALQDRGRAYRDTVLALGGSVHPMEVRREGVARRP